ncbi:MAG: glutaminyl-peptide cyclotransferase [Winogradskyella sp.]|nr:glutaminyl-peptide cyclotransferase [Winogradskyella sp.]
MRIFSLALVCFTSLLILNCGDKSQANKSRLSIKTNTTTLKLGDTLVLSIKNPKNIEIDSVLYFLDDVKINNHYVFNSGKLGAKTVKAIITYDDTSVDVTRTVEFYNNSTPDIYTYTIVNTYPHDITSYTQGLELYNGKLYESTGQYGASKLREIDYRTGDVIRNINLDKALFGEGLTVLNETIYQLTWKSGLGFVYDLNFEKTGSFKYGKSKEGWGLCNDGKKLYKSDGTERIWTLNPDTLVEEDHIQVYTDKGKIPSLNELEWINGKIYANIYQRNGVAIINPETGAVEGVVDFSPLRKMVKQHDELDVLNGIAYNPESNTIFVTGKNWDKLFEVTITKK